MSKPRVAVVLGTYNRRNALMRCLPSVRHAVGPVPYTIVVVDGGSTDGSRTLLAEMGDVVLIAERGELRGAVHAFNRGFAYAVDDGIDYVCILNDDDEFAQGDPPAIEQAVRRLDQAPGIGAIAFQTNLRGGWGVETHLSVPYANKGVFRRQAGMAAARAQGDPSGRDWWTREHKHYASDTELGLWIWRLGWTIEISGRVIDYANREPDALREKNQREYTTSDVFNRRWGAGSRDYRRDEAERFGGYLR